MEQAAVFFDRDDTLIEDPGYLADPNQVRLVSGAAEAINKCLQAGFQTIVVTNQSGIARGLITETQLEDIHAQLQLLLEADGAKTRRNLLLPLSRQFGSDHSQIPARQPSEKAQTRHVGKGSQGTQPGFVILLDGGQLR